MAQPGDVHAARHALEAVAVPAVPADARRENAVDGVRSFSLLVLIEANCGGEQRRVGWPP